MSVLVKYSIYLLRHVKVSVVTLVVCFLTFFSVCVDPKKYLRIQIYIVDANNLNFNDNPMVFSLGSHTSCNVRIWYILFLMIILIVRFSC